jgi:subtilisin-like proprotein convertase family protein
MKKLIHGLILGSSLLSLEAAVLNFSNPANISLNEPSTAHTAPTVAVPYPATISVSGVTDPVSTIRVILNNVNQARMDDVEILLVSPTGVKFVILSDAGGSVAPLGITLTFGDSAAGQVPDAGPIATGTYQPTCVDSAVNIDTAFPAPAPAGPYLKAAPRGAATFASAFAGINVNGTWSLYVVDDNVNSPQTASITGGWTVEITTAPSAVATVTALGSAPNPSFTTTPNNAVAFTATVTKQSDGTPVTAGTVTFREGATTLAANVAVNGSGQASFNISSLVEGTHAITADYNGTASFLTSSGNTTQTVDNHTVVAGSTFCNTGVITFADAIAPGGANVYPSRIFVSGLPGTISKVTVQIKSLNHLRPDDIDLLLVSPSGAKFILLSDAGGTTATSGANITFDDAAATTLPDGGPIVTGTYRPSSYTSADTFPSPAPAGPYLTPEVEGGDTLAAFNGATPNGTWTLYVVDDIVNGGQVNTIALGWCLTFVTSGDAATTTVLGSSANPSFTGDPVVFTATVTSSAVPVTQGTVTFKEGATTLAGPITLNASGQAKYTNSAFAEGTHTLSAVYNGSPGFFNTSSGNLVQQIDNHTVVTGNSYCNTGIVFFADAGSPGVSTPYPSHVFVSGVTGTVNKVTVQLKTLNHIRPDDIEILLVGPTGAGLVLMSDAGGTTVPVGGVTLTLDDSAASLLPDDVGLATGSYRPTQYGAGDPFPGITPGTFGEPAPGGVATLASTFNGLNPNGTWNLYVVDDVANGGQGATIANGWCVNIIACVAATITAPPAVCGNSAGNQASGPPTVGSYAWTISNGTITSATNLQTITYTAGSAGNVTLNLTVVSTTGCGQSNSLAVPITTAPAVPTISLVPSTVCPNSVGNQAGGPAGATTYSWTITNGTITTATNIQNILYTAGPSGNVGLTLRVSNAAGCNTANSTNVSTLDVTPPTITCPGNITVTATGNCPAVVVFTPSGSDNCGGLSITCSPPSGLSFPVGTTPVVCTARDTAGNTNICSFNITVLPGTAPRLAVSRTTTNVVLSWPSAYTCYTLQFTPRLFPSPTTNNWTNFPGPFVTNAGRTYVTNSTSLSNRFFRLRF